MAIGKSTTDTLTLPGLPKLGEGMNAGTQVSTGQSSTYFQNPELAKALAALLGNQAQQAGADYMDFVKNPASNPIFQSALGGLLDSLAPSENNARVALADQFRAAGNTASSTFADKAMGLETELLRNRQLMSSDLLTKLFPQVTEALYRPMGQIPQLLDAQKLQQATQQSKSVYGGVTRDPKNTGNIAPQMQPYFEPGGPFGVPGTIKYGGGSSMGA